MQNKKDYINDFYDFLHGFYTDKDTSAMQQLPNHVPITSDIKYLSQISLNNLRRTAITNQMAYYLASYANEIELDGYFIYILEEQSCLFLYLSGDEHYLDNSICIPMYEFINTGAIKLTPNFDGSRDTSSIGRINSAIEVIEQYVDTFFD